MKRSVSVLGWRQQRRLCVSQVHSFSVSCSGSSSSNRNTGIHLRSSLLGSTLNRSNNESGCAPRSRLFALSARFRRQTKYEKKLELGEDENRPKPGDTLDSEDIKHKMQQEMAKLQGSLIKVQPKTLNISSIDRIKVAIGETARKSELRKIADLKMVGSTHIHILPHNPSESGDIIQALRLHNTEDFHPSMEKSGLIVLPVPRPKEAELQQLRRGVKNRCDGCKDTLRNIHKKALSEADRLSAYCPKDDIFKYKQSLVELVKQMVVLVDGIEARKLKEFQ